MERGIEPKMSMEMGELAVKVDGRNVFSYKKAGKRLPSDGELLKMIVPA